MFLDRSTPLEKAVAERMLPELEVFAAPYDTTVTDSGIVRIVFPEFTCVCPRTGYPDFATISLYYLPTKLCLELKSWKLYLSSFRMVGTFHETVTAHIFNTVCGKLDPRWALLVGDFLPRGNVDTTVIFETKGPRPREADFLVGGLPPRCKATEGSTGTDSTED
jgi:7-cyano-7-deazaguanine reductase